MKECDWAKGILLGDETLAVADEGRLAAHLDSCDSCRAFARNAEAWQLESMDAAMKTRDTCPLVPVLLNPETQAWAEEQFGRTPDGMMEPLLTLEPAVDSPHRLAAEGRGQSATMREIRRQVGSYELTVALDLVTERGVLRGSLSMAGQPPGVVIPLQIRAEGASHHTEAILGAEGCSAPFEVPVGRGVTFEHIRVRIFPPERRESR
jgi:hypothetical protein